MIPRLATISAVFGSFVVAALTIVGAIATPGYSHVSQFISELGATGAPHEYAVRFAGFLPAGVALLVFCLAAYHCLPRSRSVNRGLIGIALFSFGYVVAVFFPCDAGCRPSEPSISQLIHNVAAILGYVLAPFTLLTLALSSRHWPGARRMSTIGFVAAGFATVGLLTLFPASPFVGLSQRALETSVLGWVVACGIYIRSATLNGELVPHGLFAPVLPIRCDP